MKTLALISLPVIQLPDDHPDRDLAGLGQILAPVGFRPTGLFQDQNGELLVTGLAAPNAVAAMHRVAVIPVGGHIGLPLGVELGRHLGNLLLPTDGGIRNAQLFEYGKWPESKLITGAMGNA